MSERQDTHTANRQNQKKFQTPFTSNEARNYVEHNSVENISQDLVHLTKSDTASAPLISESEEREEIAAETAEVPAPAPTLRIVEEQSQTADTPAPAPALEKAEEQSHTLEPKSHYTNQTNDFYM